MIGMIDVNCLDNNNKSNDNNQNTLVRGCNIHFSNIFFPVTVNFDLYDLDL